MRLPTRVLALAASILAATAAHAAAPSCAAALVQAARHHAVPVRLLETIATVESGAWPWAVNVDGTASFPASKQDAIDAVRAALLAGARSVDVGCMQVNLQWHPAAFATLEDAFDPASNADYAARLLTLLLQETGDWATAIPLYHSHTPGRAADYARRIAALWPDLFAPAAAGPAASHLAVTSVHGPAWPTERVRP